MTESRNRVGNRLEPDEVRRHMATRWLGGELRCLDAVGSTNSVARDLADVGARHGTVVTAESQTSGRGRRGRSWVSPAGRNLYLSAILRTDLPVEQVPQIALLAGVAACDTVREWHAATIKWPNDVLIDGCKVGGILAETEGQGDARVVVIGIGLNLNATAEDFPADLRDKAISIFMATGLPIDRARAAGRLLTHLEQRYDELSAAGFAPIARAWHERCDMIGRSVRIEEPGGVVAGDALGLDADGALRVRLASGAERRIVAGDVTVVDGYAKRDDLQMNSAPLNP